MKALTADDLIDLERYEALRPRLREAIIAHKRLRRVAVGDRVTLLFEDRETLRWQVLEMARVERIQEAAALQQELDIYNDLMPGEAELSATLFIEIPDLASIQPELDRLVGLDEHVSLLLGPGDAALRVRATFDAAQFEEERISAVQYLRFPLGAEGSRRLADPAQAAALEIDHPRYRARTELGPGTRAALRQDLAGGCPPLVDFAAARRAEVARPRVLAETPLARALEPADPDRAGQVVIEPQRPVAGLLDASPELLAEMARLAQQAARELVARHGSARIQCDAAERPLRWYVAPAKD